MRPSLYLKNELIPDISYYPGQVIAEHFESRLKKLFIDLVQEIPISKTTFGKNAQLAHRVVFNTQLGAGIKQATKNVDMLFDSLFACQLLIAQDERLIDDGHKSNT